MNGHLFWFSSILIIFNLFYFTIVYKRKKILDKTTEEVYITEYKRKYLITESPVFSEYFNDEAIKEQRKYEMDFYSMYLKNIYIFLIIIPFISLVISILGRSSLNFLVIGHLLNWFCILFLFFSDSNFKDFWKEVVSKSIVYTSIVFVPMAFYCSMFFPKYFINLGTYVTVFGFPLTLASIIGLIPKNKKLPIEEIEQSKTTEKTPVET